MKTSNKLLLGLFVLIVLVMIYANIKFRTVFVSSPQTFGQTTGNNPFISVKVNSSSENNISISSDTADLNYGLFADQTKVLLSIDKQTTFDQLNEYKNELKKFNIDLDIKKIEIDSNNKIKFLKLSVNCNDGFKGTVTKSLKENEKIGFYRIYDESGDSPFGMYPIPLK